MMKLPRLVERLLLGILFVFMLGFLALGWKNIQALRTIGQDIESLGTWAPTQQEREFMRLRELCWRIALGDSIAAATYAESYGLAESRIIITQQGQEDPSFSAEEQATLRQIEATFARFKGLGGDSLPTVPIARDVLPLLTQIVTDSRSLTMLRLQSARTSYRIIRSLVGEVQRALIGFIGLTLLLTGGLLITSRRIFQRRLAGVQAVVSQHASQLGA